MPKIDVSLEIPVTGSPVPTLCSVHATDRRGDYGDPRFRGNCSGALIRDVLEYFDPANCLDPMAGSLTCGDVCQELNIVYEGYDLSDGFDATNMARFIEPWVRFEFAWLHPPYWNIIQYSNRPGDLSNCENYEQFRKLLMLCLKRCYDALEVGGRLAILIGDVRRKGKYTPIIKDIMAFPYVFKKPREKLRALYFLQYCGFTRSRYLLDRFQKSNDGYCFTDTTIKFLFVNTIVTICG